MHMFKGTHLFITLLPNSRDYISHRNTSQTSNLFWLDQILVLMAQTSSCTAARALSSVLPAFMLVVVVIIRGSEVTVEAHVARISNTLEAPVATHCYDPERDPVLPVASRIEPGQNATIAIADLSMSRACAFSWLGTPKVKDLVVWQRDTCDTCEWQVDEKGFSRKQGDGSYQLIFSWRASCFYDSAY